MEYTEQQVSNIVDGALIQLAALEALLIKSPEKVNTEAKEVLRDITNSVSFHMNKEV